MVRNRQAIGRSAMKKRRRRTKDSILPSQPWGAKNSARGRVGGRHEEEEVAA